MRYQSYKGTISRFFAVFCALFLVACLVAPQITWASGFELNTLTPVNNGGKSVRMKAYIYVGGDLVATDKGNRFYAWFDWGKSSGSGFSYSTKSRKLRMSQNLAPFTHTLKKLKPGTYYYRVVAVYHGQFFYGNSVSFTVLADGSVVAGSYYTGATGVSYLAPSVTTYQTSNITENSAQLNGSVDPRGRTDVIRWFQWGRSTSLGSVTPQTYSAGFASSFSAQLNKLEPNTTYYYRAVAQNPGSGNVYGSTLSFTTPASGGAPARSAKGSGVISVVPIVATQQATLVGKTGAALQGVAFPGGNDANGWFEWGKTVALGNITSAQFLGADTSVKFSRSLRGLSSGTTYYYRAVVKTDAGVDHGSIISFTTQSAQQNRSAGQATVVPTESSSVVIELPIEATSTVLIASTTPSVPEDTHTDNSELSFAGANAVVYSGGFFPSTLLEWAVLTLVVFVLISFMNYLYNARKRSKREIEEEERNAMERAKTDFLKK